MNRAAYDAIVRQFDDPAPFPRASAVSLAADVKRLRAICVAIGEELSFGEAGLSAIRRLVRYADDGTCHECGGTGADDRAPDGYPDPCQTCNGRGDL